MKCRILFSSLIVTVLSLLVAAGCTLPAGAPAAPPAEATPVPKIRIAAVLPSGIDDLSWNQSMYEGLMKVQKELGEDRVEVAISEGLYKIVDAGPAIRDYASKGYDIVIAHGSQYQTVIEDIASDFPDTTFAYGTGFATQSNVFAYDPQAQQGAYLMGLLAAGMTKSKIVGIVGAVQGGDAIKFSEGFKQGVAAGDPDVKVLEAYTGSFVDFAKAREIALADIDNGADVLTGTAQQSVGAIKAVAEKPGVYWLSNDMDQSSLAPNTVLAAQVYHWEDVIKTIIERRQAGVLGGEHITLDFASGRLSLEYNPKLADKIPAELKAKVAQALEDIKSGKIVIELPK
ncbi:MAG TPA: BMP family ABC transporter substrate-binding protein [Anaerolineae bacterium]|nr:BMP family ABC transporter substrate-binding protein [Anaerolineae bacterium]HIQ06335.1 BMP family ABC transporter substrate-binding protein [Anaerolineae bacterium]